MVRRLLSAPGNDLRGRILGMASDYLSFREDTDLFFNRYILNFCTPYCFHNKKSACCSRDGIIVHFGDVVINAVSAGDRHLDCLEAALNTPHVGSRCVFLGPEGCRWAVKPTVCEMFLCDPAKKAAFGDAPGRSDEWDALCRRARSYYWPDRPVLFEVLERIWLDAGYRSTLMHIHLSPGLRRIRQAAGRTVTP